MHIINHIDNFLFLFLIIDKNRKTKNKKITDKINKQNWLNGDSIFLHIENKKMKDAVHTKFYHIQ